MKSQKLSFKAVLEIDGFEYNISMAQVEDFQVHGALELIDVVCPANADGQFIVRIKMNPDKWLGSSLGKK